jgi:hypothetical protein
MLPIIFMIHDFEEILMAEVWGKRYKEKINQTWPKREPFGLNEIHYWHTPTLSIGVELEFLLFSLISWFSVVSQNYIVWFGAFAGLLIHMVFIHMFICVQFKNYVPGVITSVILLLPGMWFLYSAEKILHYEVGIILFACLLGAGLIIVMILSLHTLMGSLSKWLYQYSRGQTNE